ncbi:MAG: hypothetical protein AAFR14_00365 [Bacteroidota bacterium]
MARNVIGLMIGMAGAFFLYWTLQSVNQFLAPAPEDLTMDDVQGMKEYYNSIPRTVHMVVLASHALGALLAGFLAAKIGEYPNPLLPYTIGGFLMLMAIIRMIVVPLPVWFMITDVIVHIPCALVGYRLGWAKIKNGA